MIDGGIAPHGDLQDWSSKDSRQGRTRIVYSESFLASRASTSAFDVNDDFGHGTTWPLFAVVCAGQILTHNRRPS